VTAERRRSPRVRAPEGAEGVIRSTIQVQVGDISDSGLRFQPVAAVRPGSTYAFHADLGGYELSVPIRITRCQAGAAPKDGSAGRNLLYDAGAEFLWENPEDQARLAAWLGRGGNGSGKIEAKLKG